MQGEFEVGSQYHFHMETQSCIVRPVENGGYEVRSATQWLGSVQDTVAKALGVDNNKVDVIVKRLGGGYGGKIFKPRNVAAAAAVAASALRRPIRIVLDLQTNMEMLGKRCPYLFQYSVSKSIRENVEILIYPQHD